MAIKQLLEAFKARIQTVQGVNYAYGLWAGDAVYPYWVADAAETLHVFEDGSTTGRITLQGWTRGSRADLLTEAQGIAQKFNGYTYAAASGFACAIEYVGMNSIPQADIELKSIVMQFDFKTWEG